MELYIRVKDGQPEGHPILGDNFREAFPQIDVGNLPPEFVKFEKQDVNIGAYEVFTPMPYFIEDGVAKNGIKRDMTPEEKAEKIQQIKTLWDISGGYKSWIFDEKLANFTPPVPVPQDGKKYGWSEELIKWVEVV